MTDVLRPVVITVAVLQYQQIKIDFIFTDTHL